jgi:hypothetical protein
MASENVKSDIKQFLLQDIVKMKHNLHVKGSSGFIRPSVIFPRQGKEVLTRFQSLPAHVCGVPSFASSFRS